MEKSSLPPIYNKILFWQRFVWLMLVITCWLMLVITCVVYAFSWIGLYQRIHTFSNIYQTFYLLEWGGSCIQWLSLIAFAIQLRKSIKIGAEYEEQRGARAFGRWLRALRKTWGYFLVIIVILLARTLFEQLIFGYNLI